MSTQYTRDYFIAKFEAIDEGQWCEDGFEENGKCCAMGHCGWRDSSKAPVYHDGSEGYALIGLMHRVSCINDGLHAGYQQPTPKQRILAALRDLPA
jgi:hypothetical protein